MMSGGPIRKFTSGWAVQLFAGRCAHFFERDRQEIGFALSACGRPTVVAALRGAGTFKRCKICERKAKPQ